MSTHKRIDIICIAAILLAVIAAVLFLNGKSLGIIPAVSEASASDLFTANDLDADWSTSSSTNILLSDNGSAINGNGAYVYDGDVYIVYAGHYVLTGELSNGSIIIDADKSDKIWISLSGVTLHCEDDAAIRVEQAGKVFLTLADDAENTLSSGAQYNDQITASGVDGCIYSRDDLTINGTGSLVINAAYKHGIVCNDDLVVAGGNLTISAAQDGIHANDSVRICNSAITISAGDDGITVSNDDETAFLYVESGSIIIPACYEGLEAVDITIAGGTIHIVPTDDGINANGQGANSVLRITGGDITIINPSGRDADGLDSNGSIYIDGGSLFISVTDGGGNCALDYGTENGGKCIISGGTVIACGGSAMAEGFDADSPQGFLMYNTSTAAGTVITLSDSNGRQLLSQEIPCSFSSVVISTPDLKVGDICIIEIDDVQEQITIDNSSSSGFVPAGRFGGDMGKGRGPSGDISQDAPIQSDDPHFRDGMEPPDDSDFRDGMEPPDGTDFRDGMEPPDDTNFRGGMEPPDDTNFRGGMVPPDGTDFRGGMVPSEQSGIHADNMALLGVSICVLLLGLCIAIKIKH